MQKCKIIFSIFVQNPGLAERREKEYNIHGEFEALLT